MLQSVIIKHSAGNCMCYVVVIWRFILNLGHLTITKLMQDLMFWRKHARKAFTRGCYFVNEHMTCHGGSNIATPLCNIPHRVERFQHDAKYSLILYQKSEKY